VNSVLSPLALIFVWIPVVAVAVLLIAAAILALRRSRAITFDEERYPGLAALRRATLSSRYVGIAGGVIVFFAIAALGRFGQGLFIAPAAAGAVIIAAIVVGQQLTYTRARTAGIAGVERRQLGDYLPDRLATIAAVLLLVLVAVAAWSTLAATSDESGLARAFTHSCTTQLWDQAGYHEEAHLVASTPFPGGYYTAGMAIGILAVLALAWLGLVATTRRPRNGADPELVRVDDALRRQTAEGIVAALGLVVATTLAGLCYAAAVTVGTEACTAAYGLGSWALAAIAFVALALSLRFAVIVLVPGDGSGRPS